jgi:hypothetical protein
MARALAPADFMRAMSCFFFWPRAYDKYDTCVSAYLRTCDTHALKEAEEATCLAVLLIFLIFFIFNEVGPRTMDSSTRRLVSSIEV